MSIKVYVPTRRNVEEAKPEIQFLSLEDLYENYEIYFLENETYNKGEIFRKNNSYYVEWSDTDYINGLKTFFSKRGVIKDNFKDSLLFIKKRNAVSKAIKSISDRLLNLKINNSKEISADMQNSFDKINREIDYLSILK